MNPFADRLNAQWTGQKTEIFFIPEYYNHNSADIWLEEQGIHETSEGLHDDFAVTATMLAVDSDSVRTKERITADRFRINRISLAPFEKSREWGSESLNFALRKP